VHTTIDVETGQIVGLEVTDESVKGDSPFNSLWNSQNPSVVQTIVSSGCLEMIVMTGTTFSIPSNKGRSPPESRPGVTLRQDPEGQIIMQIVSE